MISTKIDQQITSEVVADRITIKRSELRAFLDRLTSKPQYFFSAKFLTRRDRKNSDGTIRKAGTVRHLICKRKPNNYSTKDWTSKNGALRFDPVEHQLYHVYTTEGSKGDDGNGNHWAFICLRTCFELRIMGYNIAVIGIIDDDDGTTD